MSGRRKRVFAWLITLVVSAALVGSVFAESAGAAKKRSTPVIDAVHLVKIGATATPADGTAGTQPGQFDGKATRRSKKSNIYDLVLPFFAKGQDHMYELRKGTTVVDTLTVMVPANNGDPVEGKSGKGGTFEGIANHPKKVLLLAASDTSGTLTYPKK
jgi:hypothetical protein